MTKWRLGATALPAYGLLILMTGCRQAPAPSTSPPLVTVATAEPAGPNVARSTRFTGTVRPYRQVEAAFRTSGYVQSLLMFRDASGNSRPLQAGDNVAAGTVLARIVSVDYQAGVNAASAAVDTARANAAEAGSKRSQATAGIASAKAALSEANAGLAASRSQRNEAEAGVKVSSAAIRDADANAEIAKTTLDRLEGLYHSGSATRPEYDAAKANFDSAGAKLQEARGALQAACERVTAASAQIDASRARIAAAKAGVDSSKSAALEATNAITAANAQVSQARAAETGQQVSLKDATLRAPISGVVLARRVDTGSLVGPGTVAFSVAETSRLKVVFGIPEVAAADLRVGQHVDLTVGAQRTASVSGTVSEIAPAADERTGVVDVTVTIPNADGRVRIGMLSTLSTSTRPQKNDALAVPISAVIQSHDNPSGYAVVTVSGGLTAHFQDVEIGPTYGDNIVVRGVHRGDVVVTSGPALLFDGERVQVAPSGSGGG